MNEHAESGGTQLTTLARLAEIDRWREEQEADITQRADKLAGEQDRLQKEIAELERQLQVLNSLQAENEQRRDALPSTVDQRRHQATLAGLDADAAILAERSTLYTAAVAERDERAQSLAGSAGMAEKVQAFESFEKNRDALLNGVPELYRDVLVKQHEAVRAELQPLFDAVSAPVTPLEVVAVDITLVASMEIVEGAPETLVVILPLPHTIYEHRGERDEDLQSALMYRVAGAISAALKSVGAANVSMQTAPYEFGQHQLVLQAWLSEAQINGDLRASIDAEIGQIAERAADLKAAGITARLTWQEPEVLVPATLEGEEDTEVSAGPILTIED